MEDALIEILEKTGLPVLRQGTLGENPYPKAFYTFWNNTADKVKMYDNRVHSIRWDFDVNAYGEEVVQVYEMIKEAEATLTESGFIVPELGHDVASDEPNYIGRGINVLFDERR